MRMKKKKKKGADLAAIYTRNGADRGKTLCSFAVRFCKLIFRRATIFCRAAVKRGEEWFSDTRAVSLSRDRR